MIQIGDNLIIQVGLEDMNLFQKVHHILHNADPVIWKHLQNLLRCRRCINIAHIQNHHIFFFHVLILERIGF